MIHVACPSCRANVKAPDAEAGHTIACPRCRKAMQLPPAAPARPESVFAELAEAAEPPPVPTPNRRHPDRGLLVAAAVMIGLSLGASGVVLVLWSLGQRPADPVRPDLQSVASSEYAGDRAVRPAADAKQPEPASAKKIESVLRDHCRLRLLAANTQLAAYSRVELAVKQEKLAVLREKEEAARAIEQAVGMMGAAEKINVTGILDRAKARGFKSLHADEVAMLRKAGMKIWLRKEAMIAASQDAVAARARAELAQKAAESWERFLDHYIAAAGPEEALDVNGAAGSVLATIERHAEALRGKDELVHAELKRQSAPEVQSFDWQPFGPDASDRVRLLRAWQADLDELAGSELAAVEALLEWEKARAGDGPLLHGLQRRAAALRGAARSGGKKGN